MIQNRMLTIYNDDSSRSFVQNVCYGGLGDQSAWK